MDYYVLSNLDHDGKRYVRGDSITLTEQSAKPLIEAGVIQADPVQAQVAQAPMQEAKVADEATVGGSVRKTGEPSMDGSQERSGADTATDITPKVDEQEVEPEASKPGLLGRMFGGSGPEAKPAEVAPPAPPAEDPSANL